MAAGKRRWQDFEGELFDIRTMSSCLNPLSNHEHNGLMLDFCIKTEKPKNKWKL